MVEELDGGAGSAQEERRLYDRSRLIVDVYFNGEDATGVASTKDISLGGLYMNTQASLPEGALLTLRIPLGNERQIVVNGEVMYSNPGRGVGVRFQGLSDEDRRLMESELPKL
ncbi:MAG TPA: PilZ domain-containing protein [Pyrinomonadaceae bacterium]|nr:PilZ domain-containing protein [Pyrinomonadaceae bacterium]